MVESRAPSIAARAGAALRKHGPIGFARLALYNLRLLASGEFREREHIYDDAFDRKYGISTIGRVDIEDIDAPAHLKAGTTRYEAVHPRQFDQLLAAAAIDDPARYTFIDIGSGKGRALVLAALAGFRRVIGVEYGANLHADALANLAALSAGGHSMPIELVNADATHYALPPGDIVCLVNNPFEDELLGRFLDTVERSLRADPRDFRLIYFHCNHAELVRARPAWVEYATGQCASHLHAYAIFRWVA